MKEKHPKFQLVNDLAERLGVKYTARYQWRTRGVPSKWDIPLIRAGRGKIKLKDFMDVGQ